MEEASIIGIDLAKRSFQVHGARADGSVTYRRKLSGGGFCGFSRRSRAAWWLPAMSNLLPVRVITTWTNCWEDGRRAGRGRRTHRDGTRPVSTSTRGSGYARNCGSFVLHSLIRIRAHCTVAPSFTTNSSSPAGVQSSHSKLLERKESTSRL